MALDIVPSAAYRVLVRRYQWSKRRIPVESPNISLECPSSTLIIRPLKGVHRGEPRIIKSTSELEDIQKQCVRYTIAHGVVVPKDDKTKWFPIWVPVQADTIRKHRDEAYVVNLETLEALVVSKTQIIWVPSLQAPGGTLCTIIGSSRNAVGKEAMVSVVLQDMGRPREAHFAGLSKTELDSYTKLQRQQRRRAFEWQSEAFNEDYKVPPVICNTFRTVISADSYTYGYRFLKSPRGNLRVSSPFGSPEAYDVLDSSDESGCDSGLEDVVRYRGATLDKQVTDYSCNCKYPDLRPTRHDLRPQHRHGQDSECALGSSHGKHCIFASHRPDHCVITSSGEPHEHCALSGQMESPSTDISSDRTANSSFTSDDETLSTETHGLTSSEDGDSMDDLYFSSPPSIPTSGRTSTSSPDLTELLYAPTPSLSPDFSFLVDTAWGEEECLYDSIPIPTLPHTLNDSIWRPHIHALEQSPGPPDIQPGCVDCNCCNSGV
ncbi:hypothetical protein F5Y15DRAFT_284290 [Xylariaceae sp. FL0016]|nr:hypothetical protein F5Y15DRAFT_284290 [Xylariaceae sp. FL0016]